jgi:hypothetical protein
MYIIIKDSKPKGRTRTNTDKLLKESGWGSSFKNEEDADKCAYAERKLKKNFNADDSRIISRIIDKIK